MGYECFDVEVNDKVGLIRMNRPDRANSMIASFWRELPEIIDDLSDSGSIRAIVLAAEGTNYCSGMDLSVFASGGHGLTADNTPNHRSRRNERLRSLVLRLQDSFTSLERARMPVLCAIQGACVGAGVDMISAADLRYATESAWFSIQETNIGMTADVGTLQRLPKLIPEGIVKELAFTGRRWSAQEAMRAGFINAVYADQDEMLDAVIDTAAEIASKSPMAVWGSKQTIHYARDHSVDDALEFVANWSAAMLDTEDLTEAFSAKAEGRPSNFADLFPSSSGL